MQTVALLEQLQGNVDRVIQREDILTRLHTRLEQHEQDAHRRLVIEPMVRAVAPILRRLEEHMAIFVKQSRLTPGGSARRKTLEAAQTCLQGIHVDLEMLLNAWGIELYRCSEEVFDRSQQEVVHRVPAPHRRLVGLVARRLAPGIRFEHRIIIAERVSVYVAEQITPPTRKRTTES